MEGGRQEELRQQVEEERPRGTRSHLQNLGSLLVVRLEGHRLRQNRHRHPPDTLPGQIHGRRGPQGGREEVLHVHAVVAHPAPPL